MSIGTLVRIIFKQMNTTSVLDNQIFFVSKFSVSAIFSNNTSWKCGRQFLHFKGFPLRELRMGRNTISRNI